MILTIPARHVGLADEYVEGTVIYPIVALSSWVPNHGATVLVTIDTDHGEQTRTLAADEAVEVVAGGLR